MYSFNITKDPLVFKFTPNTFQIVHQLKILDNYFNTTDQKEKKVITTLGTKFLLKINAFPAIYLPNRNDKAPYIRLYLRGVNLQRKDEKVVSFGGEERLLTPSNIFDIKEVVLKTQRMLNCTISL